MCVWGGIFSQCYGINSNTESIEDCMGTHNYHSSFYAPNFENLEGLVFSVRHNYLYASKNFGTV